MVVSDTPRRSEEWLPQDVVEMDLGTSSSEDSYNFYISESDITSFEDETLEDDIVVDTETIKSMLAFVAVWDPADDILFLSHPNSNRASLLTPKTALYPSEPFSEQQSLNVPSVAPSSRSSMCYHNLRKDHESLFSTMNLEQRSIRGMTQTSSTLGGLDVYLKGATLAVTHRHQPVYSVLDFSSDFEFDASSVGVCEGRPECSYALRRSFLQLTTSRESPADNWSTIESPTTEELQRMGNPFDSVKPRPGRRLKKRRPSEVNRHPSPVKEPAVVPEQISPCHNHCTSFLTRTRLLKGLLRRLGREDSDWIWVEAP
ncbi:hypothetical protein BDN70DRAFT_874434 [Pholiota conissans]|uniref:Uncharacterized protein n=1 Tax=Pholiota conissans TaxID=109636 RepID=A0A9P5Z924_9AGAR|nr:hypothetical protein BDN70DRAFT_874434 [Pholiota conissans]